MKGRGVLEKFFAFCFVGRTEQGQVDFVYAETGWILTGGGMDEPRLFRLTAGGESWEEIVPAVAP